MTPEFTKTLVASANAIQQAAADIYRPPAEGGAADSDKVILFSLVRGTRGYIERLVHQINGCYDGGWYDACAVMIRRLLETLIIEAFEHHQISDQIKNANGDFLYLSDLIAKTLACRIWNLGRNVKQALPKLKDVGDKSAHSRRFIAQRGDIDGMISDIRVVTQELLYLASLK